MKIELNDESYRKVIHLLCHHEVDLEVHIKDTKEQIKECKWLIDKSNDSDTREFWEEKAKFWREVLQRDMEELEETKATTSKLMSARKIK